MSFKMSSSTTVFRKLTGVFVTAMTDDAGPRDELLP